MHNVWCFFFFLREDTELSQNSLMKYTFELHKKRKCDKEILCILSCDHGYVGEYTISN